MIEESLLKSNFVGRDGFNWWIGQVAPEKAQGKQINGAGWGNRRKVRIMGYHPPSTLELKDDDLPWAQVLLPPTAGSGKGNKATTVSLSPGDNVFGFFLDGDDAQLPVITGVFGNTMYGGTDEYANPFVPFTGYTTKVKNDGGYFVKNETNEENSQSQKSPRHVSPKLAKEIGEDERATSRANGATVVFGSAETTAAVSKINSEVESMVTTIQDLKGKMGNVSDAVGSVKDKMNKLISEKTAKIQGLSMGIVGGMTNTLYKGMAPALNGGLHALYDKVFATTFAATKKRSIAKKAGAAAQAAMMLPVQAIQNFLPCAVGNIVGSIGDAIKGLLSGIMDNVQNFVSCIGEQFMGGLMNQIIGGLTKLLGPLMGGVSKILGGFSIGDFLRGKAEGLLGLANALACPSPKPDSGFSTDEWVIGKGPKSAVGVAIDSILAAANAADSLTSKLVGGIQDLSIASGSLGLFDFLNPSVSVPSMGDSLGKCYAGPPLKCAGLKVNIFGSRGKGAIGKAIVGAIVGEGNTAVGSIIGVDLVSGGSGYNSPPFIEITDECNKGYGAVARAVIDYDEDSPTYQQVTDIYIVSEGENYPVPEDQGIIDTVPDHVVVIDPGDNYDDDTVIEDNWGNVYPVYVDDNGRITKVIVPDGATASVNPMKNDDFPELSIKSRTGYGAILKLSGKPRAPYQGEIKQVIDCVS